ERNKGLDCSLLLAVEALRAENTFEARDSLYSALQSRPGLISFLHSNEGDVLSVTFSPDGKTLAAAYRGGPGYANAGVVLWDVAGRKRLAAAPLAVPEGIVWCAAFSPDGKTLATGYNGGKSGGGVVLWDVAGRKRLAAAPLAVPEGV